MSWGAAPAGELAWGEVEAPLTPMAIRAALEGETTLLCEVTRRRVAPIPTDRQAWGETVWGETAWAGSAPGIAYVPIDAVLRWSDRHYISRGSDAPPWTEWEGRIAAATVTRAVRLSPDAAGDDVHGVTVDVIDADGAVAADLQGATIEGRPMRLLLGRPDAAYDQFTPIWVGVADALARGDGIVTVSGTDASWHLDEPVARRRYAGTGGREGPAELAGRPAPIALGTVRNAEGVPLDPARLIDHWHDGAVAAIDALYDRGLALPRDTGVGSDGDLPSYAALCEADVAPGQFATCRAEGLTRRGSPADGMVTADLRGDTVDGVFVESLPAITVRLLATRSGLPADQFDGLSFDRLAVEIPEAGGVYLAGEESVRSLLGRLLAGIGCTWSIDRRGRVFARAWRVPQERDATLTLDETDILAIDADPLPPPVGRRDVAYDLNHRVQTGAEVAGAVSAAHRTWLAAPHRAVVRDNPAVRAGHARAREPAVLVTHLRDRAAAARVADRLDALFGQPRSLLRVEVPSALGAVVTPGQTVLLRGAIPGIATPSARQAWPIGHDPIARRATVLLWG